ncbi:small heat shock protein, chloroplastic isoform X2 [Magnolia sinica]|uniref:small heat shock protein, chloroplastic isoform X2 n=1 Tax=Magnolia sinica TaxID=86752 RepID=UPI002658CCE4|nr:small heat shock protein, chloroplastic isoform X2 [Magnolia sinica]
MAAVLASKRALSSNLLHRLISPVRSISAAPSPVRSFNTNAQMRDTEDERSIDIDRRSDQTSLSPRRSDFFSDVLDPFFPSRSLSQVLNLMDQMMENPFSAMSRGGAWRGWDAKEDDDALYLRIDMPGLGKENVSVTAEQNTLIIRGEVEKETEGEDSVRRYSSRIDLPPHLYNMEGIKAEMKNGVLRVVVSKVKEEERKDVFQVKIE